VLAAVANRPPAEVGVPDLSSVAADANKLPVEAALEANKPPELAAAANKPPVDAADVPSVEAIADANKPPVEAAVDPKRLPEDPAVDAATPPVDAVANPNKLVDAVLDENRPPVEATAPPIDPIALPGVCSAMVCGSTLYFLQILRYRVFSSPLYFAISLSTSPSLSGLCC
jgi:hypothetical protein